MKHCNKCNRDLQPDQFHKNKATKDGLKYACKDDTNAEARVRSSIYFYQHKDRCRKAQLRYELSEKGKANRQRLN